MIFSLKILDEYSKDIIEEYIPELLKINNKDVLIFVLNLIEEKNIYSTKKEVVYIINKNKDAYIKGVAIKTLCSLTENIKLEKVIKFLKTKSIEMKKEILIRIIKYCGFEGIIVAGGYLTQF